MADPIPDDDRDRLQKAYNALCSAKASLAEVETVYVAPTQADVNRAIAELAHVAYPIEASS